MNCVCVQKKDVCEAKKLQSGEEIFQLFFIEKSWVEKMILFSKQVDHNSESTNAATIENKIKTENLQGAQGTCHTIYLHQHHMKHGQNRIEKEWEERNQDQNQNE